MVPRLQHELGQGPGPPNVYNGSWAWALGPPKARAQGGRRAGGILKVILWYLCGQTFSNPSWALGPRPWVRHPSLEWLPGNLPKSQLELSKIPGPTSVHLLPPDCYLNGNTLRLTSTMKAGPGPWAPLKPRPMARAQCQHCQRRGPHAGGGREGPSK